MSDLPTAEEHPPGQRRPLDNPYPFDDLLPDSSPEDVSSPSAILNFFLKTTAHHDPDSLRGHAVELQKKAYVIYPYPCIRSYAFLRAKAAKHPAYPEVLAIGKVDREAIYLDLGCFFGTDARKVVYDGWDPQKVIASDLRPEWFELGYSLFDDKSTCPIAFLAGNVFLPSFLPIPPDNQTARSNLPLSPPPTPTSLKSLTSLAPLVGQVRAISAFSFFHLFEEDGQHELARKLGGLLRSRKGSVIFGSHRAGRERGMVQRGNAGSGSIRFVHSPESWKDLWECEIFPASRREDMEGLRVKVHARNVGEEDRNEPTSQLEWSVTVM